jgi:hypothetical protein
VFHVSHKGIDGDVEALELTKRMLRYENGLRLSPETVAEYAKSQRDSHKSIVTQQLQEKVVTHFMNDPVAPRFFTTMKGGLSFLRGHAGNFPSHYEELKECAQYVRYTADCVAGPLRVGDVVSHEKLREIQLAPLANCREFVSLDHVVCGEADNHLPLLVVGSSAT